MGVEVEAMLVEGRTLDQLYRLHIDQAFRLAYLLTGNRDLAEDALMRIAGRLLHLRRPGDFGAYLWRPVRIFGPSPAGPGRVPIDVGWEELERQVPELARSDSGMAGTLWVFGINHALGFWYWECASITLEEVSLDAVQGIPGLLGEVGRGLGGFGDRVAGTDRHDQRVSLSRSWGGWPHRVHLRRRVQPAGPRGQARVPVGSAYPNVLPQEDSRAPPMANTRVPTPVRPSRK